MAPEQSPRGAPPSKIDSVRCNDDTEVDFTSRQRRQGSEEQARPSCALCKIPCISSSGASAVLLLVNMPQWAISRTEKHETTLMVPVEHCCAFDGQMHDTNVVVKRQRAKGEGEESDDCHDMLARESESDSDEFDSDDSDESDSDDPDESLSSVGIDIEIRGHLSIA